MLKQAPEQAQLPQAPERAGPISISARLQTLLSHAPAAIVMALLLGVAYFGHRHDWKLPKLSEIVASGNAEPTAEWCVEHGVPEAQCVECRPELLPKAKDYGWCKVHGISQCPLCHPEVAQLKEPAPALPEELERAERGLAARARTENNQKCTLYRRRLQFASLSAVKKAGLDVEPVDKAPIDEVIETNGEITYDHTRVAHLPAKSAGTVWHVAKKVGDRVSAGEVLALVDAVEVGRAKAEFLEALAKWEFAITTKERLLPLTDQRAVAGSRMLEAEAAIREGRSRLLRAQQALVNLGLPVIADEFKDQSADEVSAEIQFLGLPNGLVESLDATSTSSNLLPVRAPFDGVIVDADLVVGEGVDTAGTLFTVADTTQMWLTLEVSSEEAIYVVLGQTVRFRTNESKDVVTGQIDWISTEVDDQTRTVKVRAVVQNPGGKLRDQTFGAGEVVLRSESEAIVVPTESVQWDGSCQVVFVRDKNFFSSEDSPKLFYPRPVRVGARTDEKVEILAGLLPGEIVVTKGSGVLRGELLKNNLGAG